MRRSSVRGNREGPEVTGDVSTPFRLGKAESRNPSVYATGQSDSAIVPAKLSNKDHQPVSPVVDQRRRWRKVR